jgi:hypothetical protein
MTFEHGYLKLGRWRGAPVRVHWSAPVGALLLGQLRFVPGFWLAFVGLILVHELGHALMVMLAGARVRAVNVTGLGGECRYDGEVTELRRALIAWGGVLAQLAVLVVVGSALLLFGAPRSTFVSSPANRLPDDHVAVESLLICVGSGVLATPPSHSGEATDDGHRRKRAATSQRELRASR